MAAAVALVTGATLAAMTQPATAMPTSGDNAATVTYEEATPGVPPSQQAAENALIIGKNGQKLGTYKDVVTKQPTSTQATALPCDPDTKADHPHSPLSVDVSAHGSWYKGNCDSNWADVYNCIFEYYKDGTWRQKKCSKTVRVKPGGGRGKRSTARRDCDNATRTAWYNMSEVDVVGEWDNGEKEYTDWVAIYCRVY